MAVSILQPIIDEITELTTVVASTELLLVRLKTAVDAAPTLEEARAVVQLAFDQRTKLSAAVVANTPAEPE